MGNDAQAGLSRVSAKERNPKGTGGGKAPLKTFAEKGQKHNPTSGKTGINRAPAGLGKVGG